MAYAKHGESLIDYHPYAFGASRLLFRGPRCAPDAACVAFIGGTETYGRFLETPYPAMVGEQTGLSVLNFGCVNAGLDVYLGEAAVLDACRRARATVIQIIGAQNLTNRYYSVHPRRNDRFVRASGALTALYPEVDFTEFNFTRHLLSALQSVSQPRFGQVRAELQRVWSEKMARLLGRIGNRVVLFWFAARMPARMSLAGGLGPDPLFVTPEMLEALRPGVIDIIELAPERGIIDRGIHGMLFSDLEQPAAQGQLGHLAHEEAAHLLSERLRPLMAAGGGATALCMTAPHRTRGRPYG